MTARPSPFLWSEYLDLAHNIMGRTSRPATQQAKQRCAISRAYYAVFIIARNHLRDVDQINVRRKDIHRFVIREFITSPDARRQAIGWDLEYLRRERSRADYEDEYRRVAKASRQCLQRAATVLIHLRNL